MAHSYSFAVLRLIPDLVRGESVNLGIVVFQERDVDVRIGEVLTRARSVCPDLTADALSEGVALIQRFGGADMAVADRHRVLRQLGMFALGDLGTFTAGDGISENYEAQVGRLLAMFAGPSRHALPKRKSASRLITQVRREFREQKVLAVPGDVSAIEDHKIVPDWPIPRHRNLRADLALKNRIMRVCQIVDMKVDDAGTPPAGLFESVVTLEFAQKEANAEELVFAYRPSGPSDRIDELLQIAKLHASRLVNWDRPAERESFLHEWIEAATDRGSVGAAAE